MPEVTIEDKADFRTAAERYNVALPTGSGRYPVRKLAAAIRAAGDAIVPTPYFTGEVKSHFDADGKRVAKAPLDKVVTYKVTAKRPQTAKGTVRTYSANGKNPELAGKPIPQTKVSEATVTSVDVRAFARSQDGEVGERGRLSEAFTVAAAAAAAGWESPDMLTDVVVERV